MNDLATIMNYEQLKSELNEELSRTANSFVRIGYLLKLARDDRHILDGSGYSDVNEFAQKEYGLDKTQVSRFIRINDRFSIDGNSTKLLPQYEEYGSTKLSIMLTLPDEINEEISPDMSKSDIQAIKEEYDEENKITDLEVMMEEKPEGEPDEFIALVVKHLNDEHPEPAELMKDAIETGKALGLPEGWTFENDVKEDYMPDGDKIYNIRIEGQGRFMISCKESGITITNMRDPANKSSVTWPEFAKAVIEDVSHREFAKKPEKPKAEPKPNKPKPKKVEKSKPKKETVAPVQPKNAQNEPENAQNEPEIEKVEGEVVETAMNPPENNEPEQQAEEKAQPEKELTSFQKQVIGKLRLIEGIITGMETTKENWDKVNDMLRETIHLINKSTF